MAGIFSIRDTINTLAAIFEKHKNERVCVLGTTCCGKTTLLKHIPYCVDMDDVAFANITKEESEFINKTPWTKEIGDKVDDIIYRNVKIQAGHPVLGTVIVDCEIVVYLDINDKLLEKHCEKRGVNYLDAMNMKKAIDDDWNNHKAKDDKMFYYVAMAE